MDINPALETLEMDYRTQQKEIAMLERCLWHAVHQLGKPLRIAQRDMVSPRQGTLHHYVDEANREHVWTV